MLRSLAKCFCGSIHQSKLSALTPKPKGLITPLTPLTPLTTFNSSNSLREQTYALRVVKHSFLRTKALLSFPHCLHYKEIENREQNKEMNFFLCRGASSLRVYKYTIPAKRLSSISAFFFKKMKLFLGGGQIRINQLS